MSEHKHVFPSHGLVCEGCLYMPDRDSPPVVIMAQGFGALRQMGTGGFIRAFLAAGYAVFSFDYRGFGNSQGTPRQLVNPHHHCEDWYNAVQYVRSLQVIDNRRVALWGSSFAGGHVLVTAARVPGLSGAIAQVPFCTSRSIARRTTPGNKLRGLGHALLDLLLAVIGREHRVAIVGRPGAGFAAMDFPGWYEDYLRIAADSPGWHNSMPARSLLAISNYHPMDTANRIEVPVLAISGKYDQAVPREDVIETVAMIPGCRHVELDFDHFDLYEGFPLHEVAVAHQVAFLHEVFNRD